MKRTRPSGEYKKAKNVRCHPPDILEKENSNNVQTCKQRGNQHTQNSRQLKIKISTRTVLGRLQRRMVKLTIA